MDMVIFEGGKIVYPMPHMNSEAWSVVVRLANDPIGYAVPYAGETDFGDEALARSVFHGVARAFGVPDPDMALQPVSNDDRALRNVVQHVFVIADPHDLYLTCIELRRETLG